MAHKRFKRDGTYTAAELRRLAKVAAAAPRDTITREEWRAIWAEKGPTSVRLEFLTPRNERERAAWRAWLAEVPA